MRKEFRAKQFELAAKSPAAWALQARRLKRAADLVFEAYAGDLAEMHGGRSPLDLKNLESAEPATLLYGLAFENVFKTLILALVSATEPRLSWAGLEGAVLTCADPSCDNVRAFLGGTFFYDANDIVVTLYDFERSPDSTVVIRKLIPCAWFIWSALRLSNRRGPLGTRSENVLLFTRVRAHYPRVAMPPSRSRAILVTGGAGSSVCATE